MSELTLLLLQVGFLILLWFFVFALVYSLRADLFGVKVRKLPEPTAAAPAKRKRPRRRRRKGKAATTPLAEGAE